MPGAAVVLKRYLQVCKGWALPFFMLLRKIECSKQDGREEMWKEHEMGMNVFRKARRNDFADMTEERNAYYSLLDLKYDIARELLTSCTFCERRCGVNRAAGKLGWCRVGAQSNVAAMFEHWGEERVLVPSGTIFFSGCNWKCVYCQNFDISQFPGRGIEMNGCDIASWVDDEVNTRKIKNVNFVGGEPTPHLHTVIDTARHLKSPIPLIWNSNMYMSEESNNLLEGVIDLYLADFRYGKDECAMRFSSTPRYMTTMERNFIRTSKDAEMIIRILVLPNHIECCAKNILEWIGMNVAERVYINLMSQYRPEYEAMEYPEIARRLYDEEYAKAVDYLHKAGIRYYEIQVR